jgi:hypothetical protein
METCSVKNCIVPACKEVAGRWWAWTSAAELSSNRKCEGREPHRNWVAYGSSGNDDWKQCKENWKTNEKLGENFAGYDSQGLLFSVYKLKHIISKSNPLK